MGVAIASGRQDSNYSTTGQGRLLLRRLGGPDRKMASIYRHLCFGTSLDCDFIPMVEANSSIAYYRWAKQQACTFPLMQCTNRSSNGKKPLVPTVIRNTIYSIIRSSMKAIQGDGLTGNGLDLPPPHARGALEMRVCVRTYKIFYVSGTEEFVGRSYTKQEVKDGRKRWHKNRKDREEWMEKWLKREKVPVPVKDEPAEKSTHSDDVLVRGEDKMAKEATAVITTADVVAKQGKDEEKAAPGDGDVEMAVAVTAKEDALASEPITVAPEPAATTSTQTAPAAVEEQSTTESAVEGGKSMDVDPKSPVVPIPGSADDMKSVEATKSAETVKSVEEAKTVEVSKSSTGAVADEPPKDS